LFHVGVIAFASLSESPAATLEIFSTNIENQPPYNKEIYPLLKKNSPLIIICFFANHPESITNAFPESYGKK
jgi:hypothetical protein